MARRKYRLSLDRASSTRPAVVDHVLAVPLALAGLIARRLGVTSRAAQDLVAKLACAS
jgi:HTH DNA binding domain